MGRNGNRTGDAALYRRGELITALLHQGTIDVRSAPGQGSVFSVRLARQFRGGRPDAARA